MLEGLVVAGVNWLLGLWAVVVSCGILSLLLLLV